MNTLDALAQRVAVTHQTSPDTVIKSPRSRLSEPSISTRPAATDMPGVVDAVGNGTSVFARVSTYGATICEIEVEEHPVADVSGVSFVASLFERDTGGRARRRLSDGTGQPLAFRSSLFATVVDQAVGYLVARFGPRAFPRRPTSRGDR